MNLRAVPRARTWTVAHSSGRGSAGTYGCTREACEFRDAITANDHFKRTGVQVVGISGDAIAKQKKFVDEHKLGYPILSDATGEARKAYSVPKGFFGLTDGESRVSVSAAPLSHPPPQDVSPSVSTRTAS